MIRVGGSHVQDTMTLCVDHWKNLSSALALFALVAVVASGCGDAGPFEVADSSVPSDAGIDRADGAAVDSSSADRSSEDGSFEDAPSKDAAARDGSPQDRLTEDRRPESGTSSDADARPSDGVDAPDGDSGVDTIEVDIEPDADAEIDATDGDGGADTIDARGGDVRVDSVDADVAVDTDPDGGCSCTPDEQNRIGIQSLACFCADAACLSYDDAITRCPSSPFPDANRIDTYENCNLVVITIITGIGLSGGAFVYDATTHELVGASYSADYPAYQCGTTQVFGFEAGTFPAASCVLTHSLPRCVDGGDGG